MFNKFKSESGAIATVFVLAAALFFSTAVAVGFGLGKTVQANQALGRCANMVAKATMVFMQRQAPPNKGVLTGNAIAEGTAIYTSSLCNGAYATNPLMKSTGTIDFAMVGPSTLVVTLNQFMKGYLPSGWFPVELSKQAAAYTYQYGGTTQNPLYDETRASNPAFNDAAPLLGGAPTQETNEVLQATYANPYPTGDKAIICHATNSAKNPYNSIGPSAAGIINGHMGHTGIVFAGVKKSDWGDIIPPVPEANIQGLNWTPAGQAIWHNDCEYLAPSPTDSNAGETERESGGGEREESRAESLFQQCQREISNS